MTYHTWFLFLLVTSAAISCPGPAIILVVSFTSLMGYGYLTHWAKGLLECPSKMNLLRRTIGIFMMLVGLGLLVLPANTYSDNHIEISSDVGLRPMQFASL